jgi:RHS repeat-associated protein
VGRAYQTRKKGPAGLDILQDMTYNPRGLVSSQTAPYYSNAVDTYATTYAYDSLDRLTVTDFPDSYQTSRTYEVWKAMTTDEHGHATTSTFDAYGRRILMEQEAVSSPVETHYSYDLLGRMTGMSDHLGNDWSWTFDSLGRSTAKTDPDAGTWTFTYDDSGLLETQLDAKNQTTGFTYDAAARLATKATTGETVTFTRSESRPGYYNVGRATTITTTAPPSLPRVLAVDYDALGRPVKQVRTLEGNTYTAQKQYDAGGFLSTITYPDTETVGPMQYDTAGRPSSIPGYVNSITYDAAGRALQQANTNNTTTTRTYSPERGFLTGIVTTGPGGTIQNLSYTPDGAGMATQVTSPFPNESWTYGYDPLHRLTSATGGQSQTFTYDDIGRITYNSLVGTYTYPPDGQPRPHAPNTVNGVAMSYDLNGNLIFGRTRTITWNADNLPSQISVPSPSITTQFTYDGLGERLKAAAIWATGSATSIYPLGDDFEITNGVVTKHISVEGLGVVAKRRVVLEPGTTDKFWLHTDRLGSIQAITDASGAEVQRRTYRPYGQKIADSTSFWEPRGWIDQRTDTTTELTYLHARYYDPQLGVFLSPDPIGPEGGLNEYGYGLGDPINSSDPSGLSAGSDCQVVKICTAYEGGLSCVFYVICPPPPGVPGGGVPGSNPGGPPGGGTPTVTPVEAPPGNVKDGIDDGKCGEKCWADRNARKEAAEKAKWWDDFFKNLPRAMEAEFEDGGCGRVFLGATRDALFPFSLSAATAGEPLAFALGAQQYNATLDYAASRGLTYPMKSSVFRAGLQAAKLKAASGPVLGATFAIYQGLGEEMRALSQGQCR